MGKKCKALTNSGSRCKNNAVEGSDYCYIPSHKHPLSGNKFAIGNSGRSKKWETVEDLQKDIDNYFNLCDERTIEIYSKKAGEKLTVKQPLPYTIEGLCDVLECDRDTLLNYEKKKGYEEFFGTIKRAKMKIQRNKVERGLLGSSNPSVTIFDLKNNHGYVDKSEHDLTSSDGSMSPPKTIDDWYNENRSKQ